MRVATQILSPERILGLVAVPATRNSRTPGKGHWCQIGSTRHKYNIQPLGIVASNRWVFVCYTQKPCLPWPLHFADWKETIWLLAMLWSHIVTWSVLFSYCKLGLSRVSETKTQSLRNPVQHERSRLVIHAGVQDESHPAVRASQGC